MAENSPKRDNHTPSCIVCQRRKVKCNRVYPCAPCLKSRLECDFPVAKRARRRAPRKDTGEQQQQQPGQRSDDHDEGASQKRPLSTGNTVVRQTARLLPDGNGHRYVTNHLWNAISPEKGNAETADAGGFSTANAMRPGSSERHDEAGGDGGGGSTSRDGSDSNGSATASFLFGASPFFTPSDSANTASLGLLPEHNLFLWQTYLANVDPVLKIFHAPTLTPMMLTTAGEAEARLDVAEKALKAAVHFLSVASLTDNECLTRFGEAREVLLRRHRAWTEAALAGAHFVTSTDIVAFLGLMHYICALRCIGDIQTAFALLGLAIRIAGSIGLSRDGTAFNLTPFEVEMRRRLWFCMTYSDGRMAELLGQEGDIMIANFEVGPPTNLSDVDLHPDMLSLPEARLDASDAVYVYARVKCVAASRRLQANAMTPGTWGRLQDGGSLPLEQRLAVMADIEREFREEIIERCDPSVPIEWLSINSMKTFAIKLRLLSRTPEFDAGKGWATEDGLSDNAFSLSMDIMQLQLDLWAEPNMSRWRWHWQSYFQWYGLACLLRQTRLRKSGPGVARAWVLIQKVFDTIIPTLELGPRKNPLLDGIHALLNAAKKQQGKPEAEDKRSMEIDGNRQPRPPCKGVHHFALPHGAPPHSAMFPSVSSGVAVDYTDATMSYFEDPAFGLDFDAIDWVEFDRITAELIQP